MLHQHTKLARGLDELEVKYDSQFGIVFDAIRQLTTPSAPPRYPIGCGPPEDLSGWSCNNLQRWLGWEGVIREKRRYCCGPSFVSKPL